MGERSGNTRLWWRNLRERDHLERKTVVNQRIILK
jgi:hypothetical protein